MFRVSVLLAFNGADIGPARDSGVDQVASGRQSQEIAEIDTAVGVARNGGRKADEIGRAHDQPFAIDANAIHPPAIGVGDIGAAVFVALSALEREVVCEDVGTFIELEVGLAVSPRGVVSHRDAPRIGVEGEAALFISEGDRAPDDVIDRNVIATQFETVAVAGRGRAAGREHPVAVRYAILNGNGTDGPCIGFREEVPAVVNVVVSDATAEDIAGPGRQPTPSARESAATMVKAGLLNKILNPKRMSCHRVSISISPLGGYYLSRL